MSDRVSVVARRFAASLVSLAAAACASGGAARPIHSTVHVEQPAAGAQGPAPEAGGSLPDPNRAHAIAAPALPDHPNAALSAVPDQRISVLDLPAGTSIASAVTQLGGRLGWSVSVDPEVRGTISTKLRNVSVDSALREIVSRNGYAYQLQGNVLRVVPIRMESRTFTLDYVALSRIGTMSTIVQRRFTNSVSSAGFQPGTATGLSSQAAGFGSVGATGGDVLSAQSVADVWQEIKINLVGILQSGLAQRAATAPQDQGTTAATPTPGGSFGSAASTISFPDGSNLSISPMAGLINVTAMPDKLARVQSYINDFQASVLRQVSIEAKIVEVDLSKSFTFGIDWDVVSAAGKYGFSLRNDPTTQTSGEVGNVNFKLTGGTTQINAVLNALSTQGNVSVLSNEKTTALNNQRAIFDVVTDEVFFSVTRTPLLGANGGVVSIQSSIVPQQVSVGVVLDVLPQISADNILTLSIRPAVTNIDHIETITLSDGTSASAPSIQRREGDTIARLRAGETMVIGGLVQTRKDHTISGIPLLKDIPLFGKAFQRINDTETRSELVVFLTPTIISGQPATGIPGGGR